MSGSNIQGYQGNFNPNVPVTIANGQSLSGILTLKGLSLVGILLPAAFTGTALTFEMSVDGTNFFVVKTTTSGTSLSYTVAQGTYAAIDPKDFAGINYLKIQSGSTEAGARTLICSVKGI